MKNKNILIVAIAAIVAIAGVSIFAINKKNNDGEMMDDNMMGNNTNSQMSVQADTNSADYKMMAGVTGEDYDRLFLANMITHHEGAVEMAKLALTNASHNEVKDLATAIVSAQTTEINSMTSW
jgi:uncharacterized protein (DUF305 family)